MYRSVPFPQWSKNERHERFLSEIVRYRYLGLDAPLKGARILDVGCGTGNRTMLAAQYFGVRELVGFDASPESLAIAEQVAADEDFDRFRPVRGDLFSMPFEDGEFDVVVSWGVLHHTPDPFRGFKELVRVCKPGGFIGLFLYNKWNHWIHNIQKSKVDRLAGPDIEKRFEIALRLYGDTEVESMTPEQIAVFYDKYCHPHKSDHTIGETLRWFEELDLTYNGSYPPLRFRDFVGGCQMASGLLDERPLKSKHRRFLKLFNYFPDLQRDDSASFKKPQLLHRTLWSAVYAWQGRHGEYSGGVALSARKK